MVRSLLWISLLILFFSACNCQKSGKTSQAGQQETEPKGVHVHKAPDQEKIDSVKLEKTKQKLEKKSGTGKKDDGGGF